MPATILGSEDETNKRPIERKRRSRNRFVVMLFEFMFLYPATSILFQLYLSERMFGLPKFSDAVESPLKNLKEMVAIESRNYLESLVQHFDAREIELQSAAIEEMDRVQRIRARNRQTISFLESNLQICQRTTMDIQRLLTKYGNNAIALPRLNATEQRNETIEACAPQDYDDLTMFLRNENEVATDQVSSLIELFLVESAQSAGRLSSYAVDRAAYDYEYFVGAKIQNVVDLLDSFEAPHLSLGDVDIVDDLKSILADILEALAKSHLQIGLLETRLDEFYVSLKAFYQNYVSLLKQFTLAHDFTLGVLPKGVSLPAFFDLDGIRLADELLPPVFNLPQLFEVPDVDKMVIAYLQDTLVLVAGLISSAATSTAEQLKESLDDFVAQLNGILSLEDYDPPIYKGDSDVGVVKPEDEVDFLEALADSLVQNVRKAIAATQNQTSNTEVELPDLHSITVEAPPVNDAPTSGFDTLLPGFANLSIPVFVYTVLRVFLNFGFELCVQVLRFWKLFQKHRRNTAVKIKIGETNEVESDYSKFVHGSPPWLQLLLAPVVLSMFLTTFWFPTVRSSCHGNHSGGTTFAHNTWVPVVVNSASAIGDAYRVQAKLACHQRRQQLCNELFSRTDLAQQVDKFAFDAATSSLQKSASVSGVVERCVEVEDVDRTLSSSCCGLAGYGTSCQASQDKRLCVTDNSVSPSSPFYPLSDYLTLSEDHCNLGNSVLNESRFQCTVFQDICDVPIPAKVDSVLLENMTFHVDCLLHTFLCWVGFFVIFFFANSIFFYLEWFLLSEGTKKLLWPYFFAEDSFVFISSAANQDFSKDDEWQAKRRHQTKGRQHLVAALLLLILHVASTIVVHSISLNIAGGQFSI